MDFTGCRKICTDDYYLLESVIFSVENNNRGDEALVMSLGDISSISDDDFILLSSKKSWQKESKFLSPFKAYDYYQTLKNHFGLQSLELPQPHDGIDYLYVLAMEEAYLKVEYVSASSQKLILAGVGSPGKIKKIVNQFEKWMGQESAKLVELTEPNSRTEFFNPYKFYFDQGREIITRAQQIKDVHQKRINDYLEGREDTNNSKIEQFEEVFLPSGFFLLMASFEGFLNLIYELYLYPELRNDERIISTLQRTQIDIKLKLAPRYCSCFKEKIIVPSDPVKKFQQLSDVRNDFVHSNLTARMVNDLITEDNIIFRNPLRRITRKKGVRKDWPDTPQELSLKNLEDVCEVIEQIVNYVLQNMKERYKREFELALQSESFLASYKDGEYVIEIP